MSDKNPFRHQAASNDVEVTVAPPSPSLPSLPPLPPPSPMSRSASTRSAPPPSIPDDFDDDLPPPYTPAPNASIGEETVGLGPRRPFQQPPALPSSSSSHPPTQPQPHPNWTPPSSQPSQPSPIPSSSYWISNSQHAPWQNQQQYRYRQNGGGGLLSTLFGAIREIGDAVSGAQDERMAALGRTNSRAYATPYSGTGTVYAPPAQSTPERFPHPPRRPASTPPTSPRPPMVPDDGTPTQTPVPGHPLLRDGNLLVYPRDYLCVKCKNTGYKNYDPSHPCRKCWEKFAKPYSGVLAYAPWSSSGNDPRMQRALPTFVPPHLAGLVGDGAGSSSSAYAPPSSRSLVPPSQHPHHSRSVSQPHRSPQPSQGLSYYVVNPLCPYDGVPPVPGAIAVSPGDPRLGGRLCPRCGGEGIRTVILIDFETCDMCGGTGRVWR